MSVPARTLLLLTVLLTPPLAQALGLGGLSGNGALGARLEAFVPLHLAPGEHARIERIDVLPDVFARDDATPLADLVARLEREGAQSYIHLTTNTPLRVDRLRFRLRVQTTQGAVIARYALRVSTPAARSMQAPRAARDSSRSRADAAIVARSTQPVAAPPQAGEARYGPVRHGESLWAIAKRIAPARDIQATMQALHALNPQAFVGGDMNRLRLGVVLTLPTDASRSNAATDEASTRTADTPLANIATEPARAAQTNAVDALDELLRSEDARPEDTAQDATTTTREQASTASQAVTDTRASSIDPALAQRLRELDAKFAAIRAQYTTPTLALDAPPAIDAPRNETTNAPPVTPRALPAPQAPSANETPATTPADDTLPAWLLVGVAAGLVLALGLVLSSRLQRRTLVRRSQSTAADVRAADASRRAEVARKAENRVRLESEIQGLLRRKQHTPPAPVPPVAASPLAETTAPPISPSEHTLDALAITQGGSLLENDREVAIDANIAHGRYAEAEVLLRETIKAHPRNVPAKLRLAEVYYITEKLEGFAAVATDLKEHHRGDLTDEEWQRVVRMGKIIAPDLALFSGPKAVGKRA